MSINLMINASILPPEIIVKILVFAADNLYNLLFICRQWYDLIMKNTRMFEDYVARRRYMFFCLPLFCYDMFTIEQKILLSNEDNLPHIIIQRKYLISWNDTIDYIRADASRLLKVMNIARYNLITPRLYFTFIYTYFKQFRRYIADNISAKIIKAAEGYHAAHINYCVSRNTYIADNLWNNIIVNVPNLAVRIFAEQTKMLEIFDRVAQ